MLAKNADGLKKFDFIRVTVEGHCDERGTVEYNLALGERRAKAAYDYLVSLGVPADRLKTVSYGKEVPGLPASPTRTAGRATAARTSPSRERPGSSASLRTGPGTPRHATRVRAAAASFDLGVPLASNACVLRGVSAPAS